MPSNPYSDFIEAHLEKRTGFGIKKQELWEKYIEYNKLAEINALYSIFYQQHYQFI